jgi:hypothetical protein
MSMTTRALLALTVLLLLLGPAGTGSPLGGGVAEAQVPWTVGERVHIEMDHDGQHTTGYRLYLNDKQIAELPVTAMTTGVVRFANVTLPERGTLAFRITAYNADHEATSPTVTLTVVLPAPNAPGLPRIIRITTTTDAEIAADGTLRVVASNTRTEVIDRD